MQITKNGNEIDFNIIIKMHWGKLYCVNIQWLTEYSKVVIAMNRIKAYRILGYAREDAIANIAKVQG